MGVIIANSWDWLFNGTPTQKLSGYNTLIPGNPYKLTLPLSHRSLIVVY